MKKLLLTLSLLSCFNISYAQQSWSKSSSSDNSGTQFQVYTLLSDNKDNEGQQMALILVSAKENTINKLGFALTQGSISCNNYCQYYVKFDDSASKYTFSIENKAIKLQNDQKDDFLTNLKKSKEMTLVLDKQRFYFSVQPQNWKYTSELDKK